MKIIYSLSDPRTGQVRYVGITGNLKNRLRNHLNCFDGTHRSCWIRSLVSIGLAPIADVLEETKTYPDDAEKAWILGFKRLGADLTNLTDGGDGTPGRKFGQESIEKMRAAKKNVSEQTREKLRAKSLGNKNAFRPNKIAKEKKPVRVKALKIKKGLRMGPNHPKVRISAEDYSEILRLGNTGCSQVSISKRYGLHYSTVSRLINKSRWSKFKPL